MKRSSLRAGALLCATTLLSLGMAPAIADHSPDPDVIAQADATALTVSIAGEGSNSGTVTATHDGTEETKAGDTTPPISLLQGQDLLDVGTLAQDATAGLDGRDGVSAACSGVAGDGASVAEVGDSRCITGGDNVGLNITNVDLSGTQVVNPDSALGDLAEVLAPLEDQLIGPITAAIEDALAPLENAGIGGNLGAVEARCAAAPGTASGTTFIANGRLTLTLPGQEPIVIANLPVRPDPNQKVVTDLDGVLVAVLDGLRTNLETSFDGALVDAIELLDVTEEELINTVVNECRGS